MNFASSNKKTDSGQDAVVDMVEKANGSNDAPVGPKPSFKDLFAFTRRRHIPIMICAIFTAGLVAGARTAYAVLTGKIFETAAHFGSGIITGDEYLSEISRLCGFMCLLGLGTWAASSLDIMLWILTGELRARTAREKLFASFIRKTMTWYDSRENGMSSLMVGINTQIRELQLATSQTLGYVMFEVFLFLACITVAFVYSFKLTFVMLATGVPSALILWFINRLLDPAIARQRQQLGEASKHATAAITAIDLVKVYNGEDNEAFNFMSAIRRSAKHYTRQVLCSCAQMSYIKFWMIMLFVVGFYFSVVLSSRGQLTAGDALTTFYAVLIAFQSLEVLGPQWLLLAKGMVAGQTLKAMLSDTEKGKQVDKVASSYSPPYCFGDIEMTNVSFAYPSNPTKIVLQPSDFHFPAGKLAFVVGRSGSGKSTLANLLLRFYEPLTGQIRLDGRLISAMNLDWLRQNVLLVQQSSVLFNDTFLKNVSFGSKDPDNVSVDAVQKACDMALLQSTIASMPNGVNTIIGPTGCSLSGGQRQRLALARAKLREPPVLVLDEITSGLDPISRMLIMEAIRIWRHDRTTIIITHEVGQIEDHEFVYVMEDGRAVQEGLRKGLAEEGGLFGSLLAAADDVTTSLRSSMVDSESNYGDELPIERPAITGFLQSFGLDKARRSGFFHRLSIPVGPVPASRPGTVTLSQPTAKAQAQPEQYARRGSDAAAMDMVTMRALKVQQNRAHNARRSVQNNKTAAESLESLELFFLERLAKPKDRKPNAPPGPKIPSVRKILRTVWPTLDAKAKIQLLFGLLSCAIIAASDVVFAYIFAQLLTAFWAPSGRQQEGTKWAIYLTIVAAVGATATFLAYSLLEHVAQRWVNTLRAEAIKRILAQPKAWFDKPNHSPSLISQCLDRNGEEMRKLVGMFVPIVLTVTCLLTASIVWALIIRWDLSLVTLAGVPAAILTARANSLISTKWETLCDAAATETGSIFSDVFSNIRVVRALTLESYFTTKHTTSTVATYRVGTKRALYIGFFYGLHQSMILFLTALVFYYGARLLAAGQTTLVDVLRIINLLLFAFGTSIAMLSNLPQIAAAKTTAVQLLHFANLPFPSTPGPNRPPTPLPIIATNLRFAYPSAPATQVLRNITLTINSGTAIAIVGPSGCGKSTLASLLLRLYQPAPASPLSLSPATSPFSDPRPVPLPDLTYAGSIPAMLAARNDIAYAPQTPFLFPGTIRGNITYGLPETSVYHADEHVEYAAKRAGIHDFVVSLPMGYDTLVGEGGIAVSGGQAQRLALARALVRKPSVVVLDEPTSALDAEGAEGVRGLVRELRDEGVAVVVVTHSKEMMRVVDEVVMVEGGRVVERGRYQELVMQGGRFGEMVGGGLWKGPVGAGKKVDEETLRALEGN
ncbi:hypothetical protein OQA88_3004 [Cercophora sp. LCS_1]